MGVGGGDKTFVGIGEGVCAGRELLYRRGEGLAVGVGYTIGPTRGFGGDGVPIAEWVVASIGTTAKPRFGVRMGPSDSITKAEADAATTLAGIGYTSASSEPVEHPVYRAEYDVARVPQAVTKSVARARRTPTARRPLRPAVTPLFTASHPQLL